MSDKLFTLPVDNLLRWILAEEANGSIFGISKDLFFIPSNSQPFRMKRYGQLLETPIGVAAGPHTQLSQNIIASWLTGARYIELKTVQTLDEIEVSKPCIDMQDEGYNCEWSQELKLRQSFDQYLDAWILIHLLQHHLGWENSDGLGTIFNISVGYDLAGIKKANVQEYLDLMENCQPLLDEKIDLLAPIYPAVKNLRIPSRLSDNVTLSTMHGCPPDEIERIARYLIEERKLHTAVKLNPTLLGPELLRTILNDKLGFTNVNVPDQAFEHDLKYGQALKIIHNLTEAAEGAGVEFGLKLTNTLEVLNLKDMFPEKEKQAYLSGRALHPLSINLASRLQNDFDGSLDLSFCAGADCYNITDLVACNLGPVTTCSDILKPGGYGRLSQYLENLQDGFVKAGAGSMDDLILGRANSNGNVKESARLNLETYAADVLGNELYSRSAPNYPSIKTGRSLDEFDCVSAPCIEGCATDQAVPDYMYHTATGDFDKAYEVILETNPMPGVTGYVCDHICQNKCTRINYDRPLMIREIKRFVTDFGQNGNRNKPGQPNGKKVAVIGGGPSGLSCAYFLALNGFQVEILEAKEGLGGMVAGAIPHFRLGDSSIDNDLKLIEELGIEIHFNQKIDKARFEELRRNYDFVYLGVGAQSSRVMGIEGEDSSRVLDPLEFLSDVKKGKQVTGGSRVIIVGGGNTAMDACRTARRLAGAGGEVKVIYRRTMGQMPADWEEIEAAIAEGIEVSELVAPVAIEENPKGLKITCRKMKLGDVDSSGRPRPVEIPGSDYTVEADYLIPAVGQVVDLEFLESGTVSIDSRTQLTDLPGVYAGGDAVRGAYNIVSAIGDGKRAAEQISQAVNGVAPAAKPAKRKTTVEEAEINYSRRNYGQASHGFSPFHTEPVKSILTADQAKSEASRCLYCDEICDVCITVCPNRANLAYTVDKYDLEIPVVYLKDGQPGIMYEGRLDVNQPSQILNITDFCNECGNCTTFCPTSGDPYLDKPRLSLSEESFAQEQEGYLLKKSGLDLKDGSNILHLRDLGNDLEISTDKFTLKLNAFSLKISGIDWTTEEDYELSLDKIIRAAIFWKGIGSLPQLTAN